MNSQTVKPFSENISFQEQNAKNECDALTCLNSKFLDLCKKYTNKADYRMLMDNYRKCVENINSTVIKETDSSNEELVGLKENACSDLSSIDNSAITNQMGSDLFDQVSCEDNSDDEKTIKGENCFGMTASDVDFSNKRRQVSQEMRNQSNLKKNQLNTKIHEYDFNLNFERRFNKFNKDENQMTFNLQIYKFLIHFYDVNCPAYKKFHIEPEKPIKKVPHYDWPFLDVPTKPRSVFDSGPTREEVGEYNRRIFDLITQNTFPYPRKIVYRCNPNFYDGDVPNELHEQIFKIDVEIYKYNGDAFIYDDRVTLRIYSINELKYMSLKNKQGNINLNAEIEDFKFVTEEHGKFIDVLFLQDFVIYRLLFRDRYQLESVMRLVV